MDAAQYSAWRERFFERLTSDPADRVATDAEIVEWFVDALGTEEIEVRLPAPFSDLPGYFPVKENVRDKKHREKVRRTWEVMRKAYGHCDTIVYLPDECAKFFYVWDGHPLMQHDQTSNRIHRLDYLDVNTCGNLLDSLTHWHSLLRPLATEAETRGLLAENGNAESEMLPLAVPLYVRFRTRGAEGLGTPIFKEERFELLTADDVLFLDELGRGLEMCATGRRLSLIMRWTKEATDKDGSVGGREADVDQRRLECFWRAFFLCPTKDFEFEIFVALWTNSFETVFSNPVAQTLLTKVEKIRNLLQPLCFPGHGHRWNFLALVATWSTLQVEEGVTASIASTQFPKYKFLFDIVATLCGGGFCEMIAPATRRKMLKKDQQMQAVVSRGMQAFLKSGLTNIANASENEKEELEFVESRNSRAARDVLTAFRGIMRCVRDSCKVAAERTGLEASDAYHQAFLQQLVRECSAIGTVAKFAEGRLLQMISPQYGAASDDSGSVLEYAPTRFLSKIVRSRLANTAGHGIEIDAEGLVEEINSWRKPELFYDYILSLCAVESDRVQDVESETEEDEGELHSKAKHTSRNQKTNALTGFLRSVSVQDDRAFYSQRYAAAPRTNPHVALCREILRRRGGRCWRHWASRRADSRKREALLSFVDQAGIADDMRMVAARLSMSAATQFEAVVKYAYENAHFGCEDFPALSQTVWDHAAAIFDDGSVAMIDSFDAGDRPRLGSCDKACARLLSRCRVNVEPPTNSEVLSGLKEAIDLFERAAETEVRVSREFLSDLKDLKARLTRSDSHRTKNLDGLRVGVTDDPNDMLLLGSEVSGSCQRIDGGNLEYNKCLMSYVLDGKTKAVAIFAHDGSILARAVIRLLVVEKGGKAEAGDTPEYNDVALFLEKTYKSVNCPETLEVGKILLALAERESRALDVNVYEKQNKRHQDNQGQHYDDTDSEVEDDGRYVSDPINAGFLVSLGGPWPFEYVDALHCKTAPEFRIPVTIKPPVASAQHTCNGCAHPLTVLTEKPDIYRQHARCNHCKARLSNPGAPAFLHCSDCRYDTCYSCQKEREQRESGYQESVCSSVSDPEDVSGGSDTEVEARDHLECPTCACVMTHLQTKPEIYQRPARCNLCRARLGFEGCHKEFWHCSSCRWDQCVECNTVEGGDAKRQRMLCGGYDN